MLSDAFPTPPTQSSLTIGMMDATAEGNDMPNLLGSSSASDDAQAASFTDGDVESPRGANERFDLFEDEFSDRDSFEENITSSNGRKGRRSYTLSTTALASVAAAAGAAAAAVTREEKSNNEEKNKSQSNTPRSPEPPMTPSTVATEESQSPANNSTVTVEHRVKQGSSRNSFAKLKKPVIAMIAAYVLFMTGSAAFLFTRWLSIPGLTDQIDRLEGQVDELEKLVDRLEIEVDRLSVEVDRLDSEVDRLSEENDRFSELNDELAANNAEYKAQNEILSNTTERYEQLNMQLNASNAELERLNGELQEQNEQYAALNDELNATSMALNAEVNRLQNVTTNLTQTNADLFATVTNLTAEVETLADENYFLNNTVFALSLEIATLVNETQRLAELNANLATITSFLNETANGLNASYNAISEFLSEQITAYRGFVVDTLKNVYVQRVTNWDCDFRSYFLTKPFARDPSLSIGDAAYPEVLDYLEDRIFSELCLDAVDYEVFLETEYVERGQIPPANATTNDLKQSIQTYTRLALSHYFPESGASGIESSDWAAASYNCENLPAEKRFGLYT